MTRHVGAAFGLVAVANKPQNLSLSLSLSAAILRKGLLAMQVRRQ